MFSLSSFKGKIENKKSFGSTGEMLWGAGRSPHVIFIYIQIQTHQVQSYKPGSHAHSLVTFHYTTEAITESPKAIEKKTS